MALRGAPLRLKVLGLWADRARAVPELSGLLAMALAKTMPPPLRHELVATLQAVTV